MRTVSILVTGKVQGVFYRQSAKEKAEALLLSGVVWNNTDGTVSIKANGTEEQLNHFIEWCHQGPRRATVDEVNVTDIPAEKFDGFRVVKK